MNREIVLTGNELKGVMPLRSETLPLAHLKSLERKGFGNASVFVFLNSYKPAEIAAGYLFNLMKEKKNPVVGLATGGTFEYFYDYVSQNYKNNDCTFKNVSTFNLDEYVGIAKDNPNSYHHYIDSRFYSRIDIKRENAFMPDGMAKDLQAEADIYDKRIASKGGIDLQFLGIGTNGHIGFNEPGTSFDSATHVAKLSESTVKDNSRFFKGSKVPESALTMGMSTIFSAKKIVVIATGKQKNGILRKIQGCGVTEEVPATILKMHHDVTFLLDSEAAHGLSVE